jgi:hypothetical protein
MIKKINEPCRAFSTTGSFLSLNKYPKRSLERDMGKPLKKVLIFVPQVHVLRDLNADIYMTQKKFRYVKTSSKKGLAKQAKHAISHTI